MDKFLYFIACCCLFVASSQAQNNAQNQLVVDARITGLASGTWLYYGPKITFKTKKDSILTQPGGFHIIIPITKAQADIYTFKLGKNLAVPNVDLSLYVEPGQLNILSDGPNFKSPKTSGSQFANDYLDYTTYIAAVPDSLKQVSKLHEYVNLVIQRSQAWILSHPSSIVGFSSFASIYFLFKAQGLNDLIPIEALATSYNTLSPQLKNNLIAKRVAEEMKLMIGQPAPLFAEPDTAGKMISLKEFRGKYVLVDFWASWCAPCRAENPNVIHAYNQFKNRNFTVLGVSWDRPGQKEKWVAAIKYDRLPWTQISDLKSPNATAELYQITGIPSNVLIDPEGKIVARDLRGNDLQSTLDLVLPQP